MIKDEYTQKSPSINCVTIDDTSGVVYFKANKTLKQSCNASNDDILLEFLNMNSNSDYIRFISKYGLLDNQKQSQEHYKVKNSKDIKGYVPVAAIDEYREMQDDIKCFLDVFPKIHQMVKSNDIDKNFKAEDVEPYLYDRIEELNRYIKSRKVRITYSDKFDFYEEIIYISLRHLIYCKLAEALTGTHIPKRCEKCHEQWVSSFRKNAIYCDNCRKTAATQKQRDKKKNDIKEQVYLGVYGHINTKYQRGNEVSHCIIDGGLFDYQGFLENALEIKRSSSDFYKDLDDLCRKACSCKKCQAGLATYFKDKIEKKLHSN